MEHNTVTYAGARQKKIRVLLAKVGLDGHDRGVKVIARALSDHGMEVIYTGLRQTPEQVVAAAAQEDADVIAVSILSGAHMTLVPEILGLRKKYKCEDIPVVIGGIIPDEDSEQLKKMGVSLVMGPGSSTKHLADAVKQIALSKTG
ncbi:MAG: cobalamin B12-binding domain-containing protein [Thermoprotei archaeon]